MFRKKGFTLVEVLLVIIIIGVLAAIVIPRITFTKTEAQEQACRANIAALNSQIELYRLDTGDWPPATPTAAADAFWDDIDYFPEGPPTCPVTGTTELNYTIDATTHRVILSTHLTAAGHS